MSFLSTTLLHFGLHVIADGWENERIPCAPALWIVADSAVRERERPCRASGLMSKWEGDVAFMVTSPVPSAVRILGRPEVVTLSQRFSAPVETMPSTVLY